MNTKNPNGPKGVKSSVTVSRFVRVIPSSEYAAFVQAVRDGKQKFYRYDEQNRRVE